MNGTERRLDVGTSVAALVESLGYGRKQVVVELNGEPVERARFADVALADGDHIEVVRAVAGG